MAGISSSTLGSQTAAQAGLQQLKVQQALQNAERAEQLARSLRSQANEAQRTADRAQEEARVLYVRSDQAQSAAGQARQGVAMMKSAGEMQTRLAGTVEQASARQERAVSPPAPVLNSSGQVTGIIVNTTA